MYSFHLSRSSYYISAYQKDLSRRISVFHYSYCQYIYIYKGRRRFYHYGILLALLFFIRPNNICYTLSIILCELFEGKGGKDRLLCLAKVVVGIFVVALPILITAYKIGILYDMFDATIITNIRYRFDEYLRSIMLLRQNFIHLSAIVFFPIIIFVANKDKRMVRFAIVSSIIIMLVYCTGQSFKHYFMIGIPLLSIGFGLLIKPLFIQSRYALIALTLLPITALSDMVLTGALKSVGLLSIQCFHLTPPKNITNNLKKEKAILNTFDKIIPSNERNKIYLHNYWEVLWVFQYFRTLPINKYATASIYKLARYKHGIDEEIIDNLNESKPLWIITNPYSLNGFFREIIEQEYHCVANNMDEEICIYKRKNNITR